MWCWFQITKFSLYKNFANSCHPYFSSLGLLQRVVQYMKVLRLSNEISRVYFAKPSFLQNQLWLRTRKETFSQQESYLFEANSKYTFLALKFYRYFLLYSTQHQKVVSRNRPTARVANCSKLFLPQLKHKIKNKMFTWCIDLFMFSWYFLKKCSSYNIIFGHFYNTYNDERKTLFLLIMAS